MIRFLRSLIDQPWGRFLRQLATLIGAIVGLALLAWIGVIVYAGYWLPDMKGFTYDDRTVAVNVALGLPGFDPNVSPPPPCEGRFRSRENPSCLKLSATDKGICRWWLFEGCKAYVTTDIVLTDPNLLGPMMDAVLNPCNYWRGSKENQHRDCYKDVMDSRPIVILFKGPDQQTLFRID